LVALVALVVLETGFFAMDMEFCFATVVRAVRRLHIDAFILAQKKRDKTSGCGGKWRNVQKEYDYR